MKLRKAKENEITVVSRIYDLVRDGEYCVWSESYPTVEHAKTDFEAGCLYVFENDGEIIGCASVEPVAEDDDLPFWKICDGTHREVSRIAIVPECQGRGYARIMVEQLVETLKTQGVRSIHLLAAKKNPPAMNTYCKAGFEFIGECFRYGADYFVCEKVL